MSNCDKHNESMNNKKEHCLIFCIDKGRFKFIEDDKMIDQNISQNLQQCRRLNEFLEKYLSYLATMYYNITKFFLYTVRSNNTSKSIYNKLIIKYKLNQYIYKK